MKNKSFSFSLPENVIKIIEIFKENGYRCDIVGGCVRDLILGKTPNDYDMTTNATPEEMKKFLKGHRLLETGIKHGTVTLLLNSIPYEITTYRIDGEYTDNRRPDSVAFTDDIAEDLSRRDFTVNAIAYNPYDGITDPHGGIADIKKRLIRCVGDPDKRFSEDALRILRAIRFSSVLGFSIDNDTADSALKKCSSLKNVSEERIYTEWKKLLLGDGAIGVINRYLPIINVFLPYIKGVGEFTDAAISELSFTERQCALFSVNASPEEYRSALKTLKSDTRTIEEGVGILSCICSLRARSTPLMTDFDHLSLLSEFSEPAISALRVLEAQGKPCGSSTLAQRLIASGAPYRLRDLAVNGKELEDIGIMGAEIGIALKALLKAVTSGDLENTKEALLDSLRKG